MFAANPNAPEANVVQGRFEDGTAFEYLETSKRHLALIHDASTNESVIRWMERVFDEPLGHDARPFYLTPGGLSMVLLVIVILVSMVVLRREIDPERTRTVQDGVICLASLLAGGAVSRFAADHLIESNGAAKAAESTGFAVLPYLQVAGALAAVVCVLRFRRSFDKTAVMSFLKEASFALGVFVISYALVLGYVDSNFLHVAVGRHRFVRFVALTLSSFPVTLAVRYALPTSITQSRWRFSAIVLVWWVLLAIWGINVTPVGRSELVELALFLVAVEAIAHLVRRSAGFSGALAALLLGCLFSTLYPVLDGIDFVLG
jgi:hypothetical protein